MIILVVLDSILTSSAVVPLVKGRSREERADPNTTRGLKRVLVVWVTDGPRLLVFCIYSYRIASSRDDKTNGEWRAGTRSEKNIILG